MSSSSAWTAQDTWSGVTVWCTVAFTPLFVFLACVLQPDTDISKTVRNQWFYSTEVGSHRILAEWHTCWLVAVCGASGVAQFLAWREDTDAWYYPLAMCVFFLSVALQWAWIAAYFRLVNRFVTARICLVLALLVNSALGALYIPLHKMAAVLIFMRVVVHEVPMLVIANAAVRIHATGYRGPRRSYTRTPPPGPVHRSDDEREAEMPAPQAAPPRDPPRRKSGANVIDLLGIQLISSDKDTAV